jgi:hypothetical protein
MGIEDAALSERERALLERVAERVVELHLEVPAILTLETARPLSVVAGQAMLFFEPLVQALLRIEDYRTFALLIERRDALEALTRRIEARADQARGARDRAGRAAPPGARP